MAEGHLGKVPVHLWQYPSRKCNRNMTFWLPGCNLKIFAISCVQFIYKQQMQTASGRTQSADVPELPCLKLFSYDRFPPSLGCCLLNLRIRHTSRSAHTPVSLLPRGKGQAWMKSANKTFTGPSGGRHTQMHLLKLTALMISLLTLRPFTTLRCVMIAPGCRGHASLEGKREWESDKRWKKKGWYGRMNG